MKGWVLYLGVPYILTYSRDRLLHGSIVARSQLLHDTGSLSGPVRRP